jgi:hypothetical protein
MLRYASETDNRNENISTKAVWTKADKSATLRDLFSRGVPVDSVMGLIEFAESRLAFVRQEPVPLNCGRSSCFSQT